MSRFVLDAWPVIDYLENTEPVAGRVAGLLNGQRPVISWINLGEVFYTVRRRRGEGAGQRAVRDLQVQLDPELPSTARVLEAATVKADHRLSYADAFAAATALARDAVLLTGDDELLIDDATWTTVDLRISEP